MDIAVNLVESYLRLNGYLTLTEVNVQRRGPDGRYETITDVDVVAIRYPGDLYAVDAHLDSGDRLLLIEDPGLYLADRMVDVIVGEVKQGAARLNPALTKHEVLHQILRRLDWIYGSGVEEIVSTLQRVGVSESSGRSGATIRTRIVAFGGASGEPTTTIIPLGHVLTQMVAFMERFEDVIRPSQFGDPAPALLHLLVKCGYTIVRGVQV